jgi:hypothetical protein
MNTTPSKPLKGSGGMFLYPEGGTYATLSGLLKNSLKLLGTFI